MNTLDLKNYELRAILWLVIDAKENTRKDLDKAINQENALRAFSLNNHRVMLENIIETLNESIAKVGSN
jgi:hypothetical protein